MYSFNGMLRKAVYKTAAQSQKLVSFLVMSETTVSIAFFKSNISILKNTSAKPNEQIQA